MRDDFRRTDERKGNCGAVGKRGFGVETPELASVGIAFNRDIEEPEVDGLVVLNGFCQQDETRAGAESRKPRGDLLAQGGEKPEFAQKFSLDG